MAKLVIPDLPPGSKVFWQLDDGTVIQVQTYPERDGPGVHIGLRRRLHEQAAVLGVNPPARAADASPRP